MEILRSVKLNDLPVVCVFGVLNIELKSRGPIPVYETDKLDCRCYLTDDNLDMVLSKDKPVAIVTFGNPDEFSNLLRSPLPVRNKWFHFDTTDEMDTVGDTAFGGFVNLVVNHEFSPSVTVFTASCNTGSKIKNTYRSIKQQTSSDWEWVVYDDSDDSETFDILSEIADSDYRVRPYRGHKRSGIIGEVKRNACMLGRGEYLLEVDHDDELMPSAIDKILDGFKKYPEAGFVYTDFAGVHLDGSPVDYGDSWGYGFGSHREEVHNGQTYLVSNSPVVNSVTIRHIVAAPNHARCWKRSVYDAIGGHCPILHVADDYELLVRTFLHTRMCKVPYLCYLQNHGDTATEARRADIQRMVRVVSGMYDNRIHERFTELGVDDFIWKSGETTFFNLDFVENSEHCTLISR